MTNLNLIPGSGKEFRDKEYWDKFFKIRGSKAFEWYGEYENLCDVIHRYVKIEDKILVIGCGNSKLSESMYDVGLRHVTNIDLSEVVIDQMKLKNRSRTGMTFLKMDMLSMEFDDASFDVVVDKGTLDALMSDYSEKVIEDCDRMFKEIDRVLKVGGRYMCISLAQDHILDKLMSSFVEKGWIVRIHRIAEQDLDFYLPVFVFTFTKMKMKMKEPFIELKLELTALNYTRTSSVEQAKSEIKEYQNYGLTKFYISNKTVDAKDDVFVHLYDTTNSKYPRFTIYIVDTPGNANKSKMNGIFAVFVVPIGKEIEWLFATKSGREELISQAKYQRLAVVHLNRDHKYESLDAIIAELSPKVMDLAPKGIPASYKIPLLSMGPDVDVRDLKFKGASEISGEFFVEDVTPSDSSEPTRRLVFQSITPLIQTEVILKAVKTGKKADKKTFKPNYTVFMEDYFLATMAQLYAIKLQPGQDHLKTLIVGLGGGVLAMYARTWLKNVEIDAVEIDPSIVKAAKDWFDVVEDDKLRLVVDDGLKFVREAAQSATTKWDVIVIDINSSDSNNDLWGPTRDFIDETFLDNSKSVLSEKGVLVINMICLSEELRSSILQRLHARWSHLFSNKVPKYRNEILFCTNLPANELFYKQPFDKKSSGGQHNLNTVNGDAMTQFQEFFKAIKEV